VSGFSLDGGNVLEGEPRERFDEGVVYGVVGGTAVMTVAWRDELPETTLEEAVAEDLRELLSAPGAVLIDREPTALGDTACVRTFALHLGAEGEAGASEQWRLLAAGRRWTVSALTALADQPAWGPALAAVAGTFHAG
jgi:hypothetical protein